MLKRLLHITICCLLAICISYGADAGPAEQALGWPATSQEIATEQHALNTAQLQAPVNPLEQQGLQQSTRGEKNSASPKKSATAAIFRQRQPTAIGSRYAAPGPLAAARRIGGIFLLVKCLRL